MVSFRGRDFKTRSLGAVSRSPSSGHYRLSEFLRYIKRCIKAVWTPLSQSRSARKTFRRRAIIACAVAATAYVAFLWFTFPDVSNPTSFLASQSTVIMDRNGIELYRLFNEEDRTFIPGERIPLSMKQATISIEDERFYERGCLDLRAIARAIFFLGRAGGGSTITRQLARNVLNLQQENRYQRKVKEFILGCQLEHRYEKKELLELYLNWIPFGRNAYGVEQAARQYFSVSAEDLTLAQSAILASLPQRPSYFSPYGKHVRTQVSDAVFSKIVSGEITGASEIRPDDITIGLLGSYAGTGSSTVYIGGRTDQVLRNMEEQGYITEAERLSSIEQLEKIIFEPTRESIRAPHFVLWVRQQVEEIFAGRFEEGLLEQGGLRIETTLDWDLQQRAEESIARYREDLTTRFGGENMALVALDPRSNDILSYVGNMDYADEENGGKIDMAQAPRQPGSSFKPFVYAAAFQRGFGPATPIYDVPTKIGNDEPQNYDGRYKGLMTIRTALGASRNVPAAKAYFLAGQEDQILTLVSALGAPTPLLRKEELQEERGVFDYGWPLALGAAETPLLEMANAYGALARGGIAKPVISIRRITDSKGNLLYSPKEEEGKSALDPRIAYQITSILSDESARPEEYWRTQLSVPGYKTAAKTGTSNKCMEWKEVSIPERPGEMRQVCLLRKPDNAWVLGYTPNLVVGAWMGNADSSAMFDKADGLTSVSPFWRDFMVSAHRTLKNPVTEFERPDGIITPQISTLSGQLPSPCTPVEHRRADVFLEEFPPTAQDPDCVQIEIDRVTHLLISDECPLEARASGSFLVARSVEGKRWPTWEEGVQAWTKKQMELWYATPDHSGALLPLPVAPTEKCRLDMTPGRLSKPVISIVTPAPGGTATYPVFQPRIHYASQAGILSVTFAIDGVQVANVTTAPFTQSLRVPKSVAESGQHTLTATITDEYFTTASFSVNFTFNQDTRAPTVEFILPRDDMRLPKGGELTMQAKAEDMESGMKYVQFFLGDVLLTTKPKEPYTMTYMLTEAPGVYHLKVLATDIAGNTAEDVRTLTVE